jgi:hypothetical protein
MMAIALAIGYLATAVNSQAAHLDAAQLLPRKTLAFIQIPSVPLLVSSFQMTNLGRMVDDPQIQPFMTGMFQAADNALTKVKDITGLSLAEIAAIPQGEITLALVPLDDPNSDAIGFVGLVDCGDNIESAHKFADTVHHTLETDGFSSRDETVEGFAISIYEKAGSKSPFVMLERENTMVVCSNVESAKQILKNWTEGHPDSLSKNRKFTNIMDRCRGTKDEEPQIKFYADPIAIAYQVTRDNMAARIGLAVIPSLGLDGVKAVGGSFVFASEDFDGIMHLHLQLGVPRNGLVDLIALDSGDDTPPPWVPADVIAYASFHWNFDQTYTKGTKLWDTFQGDGAGARILNDGSNRVLGLNLEQEIIPALTGHLIHLQWIRRPVHFPDSQQQLWAIQLRDPSACIETFNKMVDHFGDRFERKICNGATYFHWASKTNDENDTRPDPSFALWKDWILVADRSGIVEHILSQGDAAESPLSAALEYKLIASRIKKQCGATPPGMLTFDRPDEQWRYWYDLAASDATRDALKQQTTKNPNNPFFSALDQGLSQNPLPPWEAVSKYFAPDGAMLTEDPTGFHYMAFALRRK